MHHTEAQIHNDHERTAGAARSAKWPEVRKAHLDKFPICASCGKKENLNVHHKRPFHLHPELELEESNLITLCEGKELSCHLIFGHLGNFSLYNPDIEKTALMINDLLIRQKAVIAEQLKVN